MLLKILKWILITIACFVGAVILFLAFAVAPIDRYDYKEQDFYKSMMEELAKVQPQAKTKQSNGFSVGFAKVNLTPAQHTALAGYGTRRGKLFTEVHDSIFVRSLVISNDDMRVAIVSADLLIIPPIVTVLLEKELPGIGFSLSNTYLSATHTHNSIGNWSDGAAEFLYGNYSDSVVRFITDQIKNSIVIASRNTLPSTLKSGEFPVGNTVLNRIRDDGGLDSLVHVLEVKRSDSSSLVMLSYTAHPTCISMDDLSLSRDYPGALVDALEKRGYDFAMFMAGAVGSHAGYAPEHGWSCTEWIPEKLYSRFEREKKNFTTLRDTTLVMYNVPLRLGDPQAKISEDWKVRPWLFRSALGEYPVYLTALRIGNVVMLGTPCDYSGELTPTLYERAAQKGMHVMVTSFNGGYIGYITPDKYYDVDHYETRLMNWYGPGSGSYLSESLEKLLDVTLK